MDVYKYNSSNAVNGFSVNDQFWVDAEISECGNTGTTGCDECDTVGKPACDTCLKGVMCQNARLRRQQYHATGANGRYVDTQNLYVFQVLRGVNLFHGICLLAYVAYLYNQE